MKKFISFLFFILLNGTVFSQIFPKLIHELYPYHDDPTVVYWREDQRCVPQKISRYHMLPNGDSTLSPYQRIIGTAFYPATKLKKITLYYYFYNFNDATHGIDHLYDTLGRKVYYEYYDFVQTPIPHRVVRTKEQFFFHGNSPWLDSLKTLRPGSYDNHDIFHYDQNDRLTITDHYYRDTSTAPWIKTGFETRIYDVNGQVAEIKVYTSQPSEVLKQFMKVTFDNANRISRIIVTNAETNTLSKQYAYFYNDADSVSTLVNYYWYNGDWNWDGERSIDLGYMNRADRIDEKLPIGETDHKLTMKYAPGETCPYVVFDDWLSSTQHDRVYYNYPTTGTGEPAKGNIPFSVYPNPCDGIFWVESPVEAKLVLQDILGRVVWQGTSTGKDQVELPGGTKGQFLLQATLNNRTAVTMVLIH